MSGINFGNRPLPGAVSGVKWNDLDGDGVKDPKEPGVPGVYIYADLNNDGFIALGEPAAITAADGSYYINDIPGGTCGDPRSAESGLVADLSRAGVPPW